MKRLAKLGLFGAVGVALSVSAASAADLPPPPVAPEAPPVFTWEHTIYAGILGGYGIGYKDWAFLAAPTTTSHQVRGFLAGGQFGINVQKNNFVYGGEADLSWTNMTGSSDCPNVGFTCTSNINWLGTWTFKVGFDVGPIIYAEFGGAVAGENFTAVNGGDVYNGNVVNLGWTAGAGVEFYVGNNWMVDVEYNYVNFGSKYVPFTNGVVFDDFVLDQTVHLLRMGISRTF